MMIKRILCVVCVIMAWALSVCAKGSSSHVFSNDEKLEYMGYFQWGAIKIDGIDITTQVNPDTCRGEKALTVWAHAITKKTIKTFFQMSDTFMVKMRHADLAPLYFYEHDKEKDYEAFFHYKFYPAANGMAVSAFQQKNGKVETQEIQFNNSFPTDVLSILYKVRELNFKDIQPGDSFGFANYIFNDNPMVMSIVYEETEMVKLRKQAEKVEAMKFRFNTADGSLFSKDHPVYIWIETAPAHRIVHMEAKLKVGHAKLDIKQATVDN